MNFLRRNTPEHQLLQPGESAEADQVYATLEQAPVNPEEVLLVGSAALVLYGATLSSYDPVTARHAPRPGDVDFVATVDHMEDLYQQGIGRPRPLAHSRSTVLRVDTPALPIDLISRYHSGSSRRHDQKLYQTIHASRSIAGTAIRIATPQHLIHELKGRRTLDPKASQDLAALQKALQKRD